MNFGEFMTEIGYLHADVLRFFEFHSALRFRQKVQEGELLDHQAPYTSLTESFFIR
jgi:hypothetical protein